MIRDDVRGVWSILEPATLTSLCQKTMPLRAGEFGFIAECVAQCENMLSIDQAQLDLAAGPRGSLNSAALRKVVKAIGYVIEADCEPI